MAILLGPPSANPIVSMLGLLQQDPTANGLFQPFNCVTYCHHSIVKSSVPGAKLAALLVLKKRVLSSEKFKLPEPSDNGELEL